MRKKSQLNENDRKIGWINKDHEIKYRFESSKKKDINKENKIQRKHFLKYQKYIELTSEKAISKLKQTE